MLVSLAVLALACIAALLYFDLALGVVMTCIAALCLGLLYLLSQRKFGGMSGDLAGFFLQMCEFALLVGIVVACKLM